MPVRSKEDLLLQLDAVASSNDNANALCRLAGLAIQGNAGAKRGRLAALASGPESRQRLGWLDLARCFPLIMNCLWAVRPQGLWPLL